MDRTLVLIGRAHQGDKAARDLLFEENTGLIYSVAKRFLGRGVEMEDLFQIGSIGLLNHVLTILLTLSSRVVNIQSIRLTKSLFYILYNTHFSFTIHLHRYCHKRLVFFFHVFTFLINIILNF